MLMVIRKEINNLFILEESEIRSYTISCIQSFLNTSGALSDNKELKEKLLDHINLYAADIVDNNIGKLMKSMVVEKQ